MCPQFGVGGWPALGMHGQDPHPTETGLRLRTGCRASVEARRRHLWIHPCCPGSHPRRRTHVPWHPGSSLARNGKGAPELAAANRSGLTTPFQQLSDKKHLYGFCACAGAEVATAVAPIETVNTTAENTRNIFFFMMSPIVSFRWNWADCGCTPSLGSWRSTD